MSYDIHLVHPITGDILHNDTKHQLQGGTYALGGTTELWLNVTYNYGKLFDYRQLYGKSGADSIPVLEEAISKLGNDIDPDYWNPTEGNVKASLYALLSLAKLRPDGVWKGD